MAKSRGKRAPQSVSRDNTRPTQAEGVLREAHEELEKRSKRLARVNMALQDEITERKRAENFLQSSENRLRLLADALPAFIAYVDAEHRFRFNNAAYEKGFGVSKDELKDRYVKEVIGEAEYRRILPHIEAALAGQAQSFENDINVNGKQRTVQVEYVPSLDAEGKVVGYYTLVTDITQRRQSEAAMRESEERLRLTIDSASEGGWDWNVGTGEVFYSERWLESLGYRRAEAHAHISFWENLVHPDDMPMVRDTLDAHLEGRAPYYESVNRLRMKSGEYRWDLHRGRVVSRNAAGAPLRMVAMDTDITEYKQVEEKLGFTQFAVDNNADPTYAIRSDGRISYANQAACRALGYNFDELTSMRVPEIDPDFPSEAWLAHWQEMKEAGSMMFEAHHKTKKGRVFPVEITSSFLEYDGTEYIWAYVRDITERRRAEQERQNLEAQIRHAQKLESLGILAGGIAHDFNNLLTGILGNAGLALMNLPSESPVRQEIQRIESASQRAAELTSQMLAYAGKSPFVLGSLNLSTLVRDIVPLIAPAIFKKTTLKFALADNLPAMEGDKSQIQQIILNLVTNASEALEGKDGVVTVSTGVTKAVQDDSGAHMKVLSKGSCVYLEVSDTGHGMDEDVKAKIFDPFFSTKFTGSGLGLAAVQGIVSGHYGAIKIDSEPGRGTRFTILFPTSAETGEHPRVQTTSSKRPLVGGTILVIDDEEAVREVARKSLKQFGYKVLVATDGREGVEIFRKQADEIVAVLLDLSMPRMSGDETFEEIRRIRSKTPVVLTSGFSEQEVTQMHVGKGLAGFLQKPFSPTDLIEKISAAIELR